MNLTGTIIKNQDTGKYVAFIDQYKSIIAQGDSEKQVKQKLERTFIMFMKSLAQKEVSYELKEI